MTLTYTATISRSIVTRLLFFLLTACFISNPLSAQTRLGIYFTQEELDIWRQRVQSGPYITKGDVSRFSPEGYSRVLRSKQNFLNRTSATATPDAYHWTGLYPSLATCIPDGKDNKLPNNIYQTEVLDAAFTALIENNTSVKEKVRQILLRQANTPGTDFSNTNRWCVSGIVMGDASDIHGVADWLSSLLLAYDFVKDVISAEDKQKLNKWFYQAAVYFAEINDQSIERLFPGRATNNYSITETHYTRGYPRPSFLIRDGSPEAGFQTGHQTLSLHRHFNNRRSTMYRFVALAGVMQDSPELFGNLPSSMNAPLRQLGARWFKESIRFGMFPGGILSDMWRTYDSSNRPNDGWSYSFVMLGQLADMALAYARMGDYTLIDYNTSNLSAQEASYAHATGIDGSEGPGKSLKVGVEHFFKYLDGTLNRYGRIRATLYSSSPSAEALADEVPFYTQTTGEWSRLPVPSHSSLPIRWRTEKRYSSDDGYANSWNAPEPVSVLYSSSSSLPATISSSVAYNASPPSGWTNSYNLNAKWFSVRSATDAAWSAPHLIATIMDVENSQINSAFATIADTTRGYGHDACIVQSNLYFKSNYIKTGYTRTGQMKPYKNGMNGPGSFQPGQGAFGIFPDVFFMYGQLENQVWPFPNLSLSANAGPDKTVILPVSGTVINGSGSNGNGSIASYRWTKVSGPSVTMSGDNTPNLTLSNLVEGVYLFRLTVQDSRGSTAADEVSLTTVMNQPPTVSLTSPENNAAFTAGSTITIAANAADPDGSISKVEFFREEVSLGSDTQAPYTATFANAPAGTYTLTAVATDDHGTSATSAAITITVTNQAPVANAGVNQTITLPTSSVTLNGSGSYDPDGTIAGYSWNQVDGPNTASFSAKTVVSPTVSGLIAGSYLFSLVVTDNLGEASSAAQVSVTVNPAPNQAPTVSITSPVNNASFTAPASVLLTASAADPDGSVSKVEFFNGSTKLGEATASPYSYAWNNVSAGTYQLTAKATDNVGAETTSTVVRVVVNANQPPTVAISSPANNASFTAPASLTINATASDADGTVTKVEFFNGATKLGEDLTSPYSFSWTNVAAGTYQLTARATDNANATTTSAVVSITVVAPNQAPVANAGDSKEISLPTTSTTLDGSRSYDPDGSIASYSWNQVSGPNTARFSSRTVVSPTVSGLAAGTYVFSLVVTDNQGAVSQSAQTSVIVNSGQSVVTFTLINADTDKDILTLPVSGHTIALNNTLKNINIRANTNPSKVGSVVFVLEQINTTTGSVISRNTVTENTAPYAYAGVHKNGKDYFNWAPAAGSYRLTATPYTSSGGGGAKGKELTISFSVTVNGNARIATTEEEHSDIDTELHAYPNPFHENTTLEFTPLQEGQVYLQVFNAQGIFIAEIFSGLVEKNKLYSFEIAGEKLPSGIYLIRLTSADVIIQKKVILIR